MNSKNLAFLMLILLAFSSGLTECTTGSEQQSKQRPNIVFIMSDDHAYQAISSYGGPLAELAPTPNIDRIADEGMRYTGCMVTNSICGPSRATILTGKYSHKNGFVDNTFGTKFDFDQLTFTKVLQQIGERGIIITITNIHRSTM